MAFDLIPKSLWAFPSIKPWFDDEDWVTNLPTASSGLSVSEDDKHVYVEAHMPGLNTEDIDVTFKNGELWIQGNKKEEEEDKKRKYYRMASSSFSYRVLIPGNVDESNDPEASYKDGVMYITFKKVPAPQPKKISIKKG